MDDMLQKYFDGNLSPEEERKVKDFMADHAGSPELDADIKKIFENAERDMVKTGNDRRKIDLMADTAFRKVAARLGIGSKRFRSSKFAIAAAVAAFLLTAPLASYIGISYGKHSSGTAWAEKIIPYGETGELYLSDGTLLRLNSGSRVTYPEKFTGNERQIFIDGEAYAQVAKDSKHPFVIKSGDVTVNVLGTTFNFKSYGNSECAELILIEGSVALDIFRDGKDSRIMMKPGDIAQYSRISGDVGLSTTDISSYKAFYDNHSLHFFNLSLADIVSDLERIFGEEIVILDKSLAKTRYFAYFTNGENLDQILAGLNAGKSMTIRKENGIVYIGKN